MSADTAPAAMPGVEEIGKLLMKSFYEQWFAPGQPAWGGSVYWDFVNGSSAWSPQANTILDLFAPILAEKERLADAKARALEYADTQFNRALAAEAALAGERERCRSAIKSHVQRPDDVARSDDYMVGFAAGANYTAEQIAAAIRAGE